MADLITSAEAKSHLRLDTGTADDAWLAVFIPAISQAVLLWLKDEWRAYVTELDADGDPIEDSSGDQIPVLDSSGEMTTRPVVKAAVLIELASVYRYRNGEGADNVVPSDAGHGYVLNKASTALLAPLRKSTVA
jgi:hypothetical protein